MSDAGANYRIARLVAVVAGLLGTVLALATPLLPVNQTTAQLNWPQNGTFSSVDAPLIGYVATDLNITVPCQAAAGLAGPQNAGKTVLLSTVPKQAPEGHRSRPADPARQRRPGADRAQRPGRRRPVE